MGQTLLSEKWLSHGGQGQLVHSLFDLSFETHSLLQFFEDERRFASGAEARTACGLPKSGRWSESLEARCTASVNPTQPRNMCIVGGQVGHRGHIGRIVGFGCTVSEVTGGRQQRFSQAVGTGFRQCRAVRGTHAAPAIAGSFPGITKRRNRTSSSTRRHGLHSVPEAWRLVFLRD